MSDSRWAYGVTRCPRCVQLIQGIGLPRPPFRFRSRSGTALAAARGSAENCAEMELQPQKRSYRYFQNDRKPENEIFGPNLAARGHLVVDHVDDEILYERVDDGIDALVTLNRGFHDTVLFEHRQMLADYRLALPQTGP